MEVWLLIVVCVLAVLLAFGMCLVVVIFGHEDDKNTAWVPKIVTVFGLWLAFASVLVLPYDVANTQEGGETTEGRGEQGACNSMSARPRRACVWQRRSHENPLRDARHSLTCSASVPALPPHTHPSSSSIDLCHPVIFIGVFPLPPLRVQIRAFAST